MNQIELSAGTIDYEDTGGDGPTLVLLHGLLMDASLWDDVIADLSADHRCVQRCRWGPTAAIQAGRTCLRVADSSPSFDRLDLPTSPSSATTPAAHSSTARLRRPPRQRIVHALRRVRQLPPGLTGKTLVLREAPPRCSACSCSSAPAASAAAPIAFGWLTRRGRRHRPMVGRSCAARDPPQQSEFCAAAANTSCSARPVRKYDRPYWSSGPARPCHAARPWSPPRRSSQGRLVEIPDSYTLMPLDQPAPSSRQSSRDFPVAGTAHSAVSRTTGAFVTVGGPTWQLVPARRPWSRLSRRGPRTL
jgi:hypothetical protein